MTLSSPAESNEVLRAIRECGVIVPEQRDDLSSALKLAGIHRFYVIAMTGRTGSTWLAGQLRQIEGAGYPLEFFSEEGLAYYGRQEQSQQLSSFVADLAARHSDKGLFGFKIDPLRLSWLEEVLDPVSTFGGPATPWIDMRRSNIVKQAFSFVRAIRSGIWHKTEPSVQSSNDVDTRIEDREVWQYLSIILWGEHWFENFYARNSLQPLRLFYEELYDSEQHLIRRILHHIDPVRTWPNFSGLKSDTIKMAGEAEAKDELDFLSRHIGSLNDIMMKRSLRKLDYLQAAAERAEEEFMKSPQQHDIARV